MSYEDIDALLKAIDDNDLREALRILEPWFDMDSHTWLRIMRNKRYSAVKKLLILRGSDKRNTRHYSELFYVKESCSAHKNLVRWLVTSGEYDPDIESILALLETGHTEFARELDDLRKLPYYYDKDIAPEYDREEYHDNLLWFCLDNPARITMDRMKLLVEELSMKLDKHTPVVFTQACGFNLSGEALSAVKWAVKASAKTEEN